MLTIILYVLAALSAATAVYAYWRYQDHDMTIKFAIGAAALLGAAINSDFYTRSFFIAIALLCGETVRQLHLSRRRYAMAPAAIFGK